MVDGRLRISSRQRRRLGDVVEFENRPPGTAAE